MNKITKFIRGHKIISVTIAVIFIVIIYYVYRSLTNTAQVTQYTISRARIGNITQTVTGTGQIAASRQLDVTSKASAAIESINVKVGDRVYKGQLLAKLDTKDASIALANAELSMKKLLAPAKSTDISNAQDSLSKSYSDAYNAIASTFLDLPATISGMKNLLYGQGTFLSDQDASRLIPSAQTYRSQAGTSFDKANDEYNKLVSVYKNTNRNSATSSIQKLLEDTYAMTKDVAGALQLTQNTLTFVSTYQPDYLPSLASSAATSINSWSSTINSDVASLLSAKNSIASNINSFSVLVGGADTLDIESQRLSLQQAQQTYDNYFIRAPFDGIVGRIPVNVYDQASGSTVIATIIGDQKVATISLNEIDAAKVKTGQPVAISLDAIDGLEATGTVSEVDLVGTISQGVVSYNVKISIDTNDSRILPGMSINATIITKRDTDVLVVPSSAVKTQGNTHYVQVIDNPTLPQTATTTSRRPQIFTVTSATTPRNVPVTIGDADDTNTAITSGLTGDEWVISRITNSPTSTTQTATAPSILNSFGGSRATGGAFRAAVGR